MRRILLVAALLALLAAPPFLPSTVAQTEPVVADVSGPGSAGPSSVVQYNLTVSGGPGATGGNFSISYYIEGTDVTGGTPTKDAPRTEFSTNTSYLLSITTPIREQAVTVVVEVNSTNGTAWETATVRKTVEVLTPVLLSATFRNDGPVAAVNVTVRFYVDGGLVGTQRIARVDPGANATVVLTWFPVGLAPGPHEVTVTADLNGDGVVDPAKGEVRTSNLFYRKEPDLPIGTAAIIGILLFLVAVVVLAVIKRRGRKR